MDKHNLMLTPSFQCPRLSLSRYSCSPLLAGKQQQLPGGEVTLKLILLSSHRKISKPLLHCHSDCAGKRLSELKPGSLFRICQERLTKGKAVCHQDQVPDLVTCRRGDCSQYQPRLIFTVLAEHSGRDRQLGLVLAFAYSSPCMSCLDSIYANF